MRRDWRFQGFGAALIAALIGASAPVLDAGAPQAGLVAAALADDDEDEEDDGEDDDGDDDDDDDDDQEMDEYVRDEIVLYRVTRDDLERLRRAGFRLIDRARGVLAGGAIVRMAPPAGLSEQEALRRALRIAPGARGDLNHLYTPQQSACAGPHCAAWSALRWPGSSAACGAGVRIGMIDTRVDPSHPALRGRAITLSSTRASGRSASDSAHGDAVASLIVGNPAGPAPGLVPRARLIAVDAFHADSRGRAQADVVDIASALDRLATARVSVVNMSLAGPANALLADAVAALAARGVTIVAAAGNEARAAPRYPAAYPGVVAVTAVDARARLYRLANTGAHIDFAAPGVDLAAAAPGGGGSAQSGTSFAAALAAGVIAAERAHVRDGEAALASLRSRARDLGAPGRDARFGWGLVQAAGRC